MNNEPKPAGNKPSLLDIALRLRTSIETANAIVPPVTLPLSMNVVNNGLITPVMLELASTATVWSPMFAPTTNHNVQVGGVPDCIQAVANVPWDDHVGNRKKHLFANPASSANYEVRWYLNKQCELAKTTLWANVQPSEVTKMGDVVTSTFKPWQADLSTGLTNISLQHLGIDFTRNTGADYFDITAWLMNMLHYYFAHDAYDNFSDNDLRSWQPADGSLVIRQLDRRLFCPLYGSVNYDPETLAAATAADNMVCPGHYPIVDNAVGVWQGQSVPVDETDVGRYLHSAIGLDGGANPFVAPCYRGRRDLDCNIYFTTDIVSFMQVNKELENVMKVEIPPTWLDGAITGEQRVRRMAIWVLSMMPSLATAVASVTETVAGLAAEAEGWMYWNGGTAPTLDPQPIIFIVPIDTFRAVQLPAARMTRPLTFGPTDVHACREFGLPGFGFNEGDVIGGGTLVIPQGEHSAAISWSAFCYSWATSISKQEWKTFIRWVRSVYKQEGALVVAKEALVSMCTTLSVPICADDVEEARASSTNGLYTYACPGPDGEQLNFQGMLWHQRLGADFVVRNLKAPRTVLLPAFFPDVAAKVAMRFFNVVNADTDVKLPQEYLSSKVVQSRLFEWETQRKAVIFDAVFTELGLPEACLLRSRSSEFRRLSDVGIDAYETEARRLQDQFKDAGDALWTKLVSGKLVVGNQYKLYKQQAEKYCKASGGVLPFESNMLEPGFSIYEASAEDDYPGGGGLGTVFKQWFIGSGPGAGWAVGQNYPDAGRFISAGGVPDYSLLFSYMYDNEDDGIVELTANSLSRKGSYSWLLHKFFGRDIKEFDGSIGGDKISLTLSENTEVGVGQRVVLGCTSPGKSGFRWAVGEAFTDATDQPFKAEQEWNLLRLLDNFNVDLRPFCTDVVRFGWNNVVTGKPALNVAVWPPFVHDQALPAGIALPLMNVAANRLPRIDTNMGKLYVTIAEDDFDQLRFELVLHEKRLVNLPTATLTSPTYKHTLLGRSTIAVDMFSLGELPAGEPFAQSQEEAEIEATKERLTTPAVKATVGDTNDRESTADAGKGDEAPKNAELP